MRKTFSLRHKKKEVRGDFEGLAIAGGRFFLVTSVGLLYAFEEGNDGESVPFTVTDTRLADRCELEGLATGPDGTLVAACKTPRAKKLRGRLTLFRLSVKGDVLSTLSVSLDRVGGSFHASSVDRDPASGTYLVLAAREHALAEIGERGEVLAFRALPPGHAQAEGIAVLPDGTIAIADEGHGERGLLTLHPRAELLGAR